MEFSAVNTIWVLVGAALVFFMQAGFAMVETGFTRAKNAGNIIMKNLMDFCIGTPVFWLVGFGLMFGAGNGFIGKIGGIATEAHYGSGMLPDGVPFWAFLIFQTVFCATSATIVSGAMAERTKFLSYCIYSLMISLVVYPVSGHWIWGGGFISQMGFHDFAGSCAVHMVRLWWLFSERKKSMKRQNTPAAEEPAKKKRRLTSEDCKTSGRSRTDR